MSIHYYTFGPSSLVTSGISNLINSGYNIHCQISTSNPDKGEKIYNIIELIRAIKENHRPAGGEHISIYILE